MKRSEIFEIFCKIFCCWATYRQSEGVPAPQATGAFVATPGLPDRGEAVNYFVVQSE
jgi:hypothetical protein